MLKKHSGTMQFSPSVVQDGATKAPEAEEECPGLLGQLCHSTAESGVAVWLFFLILLLLHFVQLSVSCLSACVRVCFSDAAVQSANCFLELLAAVFLLPLMSMPRQHVCRR